MRNLVLTGLLLVAAAPLRADDPACLLFHSTVPTGTHSGFAAAPGGPGGVVDRCSALAGGSPWALSHAGPSPLRSHVDTMLFNAPRDHFGFWVQHKTEIAFTFMLDGVVQHSTGLFTIAPVLGSSWEWNGRFDQVEVRGVHVLMLYGLDLVPDDVVEPLLEPETEEDFPGHEELILTLGDGDPELQEELLASTVPEPATLTLLASGLVGIAGAARRKREAKQL